MKGLVGIVSNSCSPKSSKGRVADQDSPWHGGCHQHLHSDANDASVQPLKLHIGQPVFLGRGLSILWWYGDAFIIYFKEKRSDIWWCSLKVRFSVRRWTPQVPGGSSRHLSPRWTYLQRGSKSGGWVEVPYSWDPTERWFVLNFLEHKERPKKTRGPTKSKWLKIVNQTAVLDGSGFVTMQDTEYICCFWGLAAGNYSMPCIRSFERWRPESTMPKNDLQDSDTTGKAWKIQWILPRCGWINSLSSMQELICIFMSLSLIIASIVNYSIAKYRQYRVQM